MTRRPLDYTAHRAPVASSGPAYSAEVPTAGWYRHRLVRGGHPVAIRIWHGAPLDPETGEEMDRSHRWQATVNGRPIDLDRVWPICGRDPITEAEARHLIRLQQRGQEHAPAGPQANPHRRIDLLDANTPLPL